MFCLFLNLIPSSLWYAAPVSTQGLLCLLSWHRAGSSRLGPNIPRNFTQGRGASAGPHAAGGLGGHGLVEVEENSTQAKQTDRKTHTHTHSQTDRKTHTHTVRQTERHKHTVRQCVCCLSSSWTGQALLKQSRGLLILSLVGREKLCDSNKQKCCPSCCPFSSLLF